MRAEPHGIASPRLAAIAVMVPALVLGCSPNEPPDSSGAGTSRQSVSFPTEAKEEGVLTPSEMVEFQQAMGANWPEDVWLVTGYGLRANGLIMHTEMYPQSDVRANALGACAAMIQELLGMGREDILVEVQGQGGRILALGQSLPCRSSL